MSKHQLIQYIGWLSVAQAINKIFRLAVTIVIARILLPEEYGMAAIILTCHELVTVLVRRSTQTSIVNCSDDQLAIVTTQARLLNWQIGAVAFILQVLLGYIVSLIYHESALYLTIFILSLSHLLLPIAMVHAALNIRQGRIKLIAKIDSLQAFVDAVLTITLAYFNFGIWSLVLPKLIVIPIWIVMHLNFSAWKPVLIDSYTSSFRLLSDTIKVICVDGVIVLRNNIDFLLIGHFLGMEILGLYFFAYNAGVGISNGFIQAIGSALLPHLCETKDSLVMLKARYIYAVQRTLPMIFIVVLLQTSLAEFYVPLVFGERWVELGAIPILTILCFSSVARIINELASQLLRSRNLVSFDLMGNTLITIGLIFAIYFTLPFGIKNIASAISIWLLVSVPCFFYLVYRVVFKLGLKPIRITDSLLSCDK